MITLILHIHIQNPPASKSHALSDVWFPERNRICEAIERAGLTLPFDGPVHLHLGIEDRPMRDLDNRIQGVFTLLDGTASSRNAPISDDGNIKRLVVERRPWGRDEPFITVEAEAR